MYHFKGKALMVTSHQIFSAEYRISCHDNKHKLHNLHIILYQHTVESRNMFGIPRVYSYYNVIA